MALPPQARSTMAADTHSHLIRQGYFLVGGYVSQGMIPECSYCLSHYLRRILYIPSGDRRNSEPSAVGRMVPSLKLT